MGLKEARAERTRLEIEVGRKRQKLWAMMEYLDKAHAGLKERFPSVRIDQIIKAPYDHVTLTVQSKATGQSFEIVTPVEGFPSDHCIAQLMLLS